MTDPKLLTPFELREKFGFKYAKTLEEYKHMYGSMFGRKRLIFSSHFVPDLLYGKDDDSFMLGWRSKCIEKTETGYTEENFYCGESQSKHSISNNNITMAWFIAEEQTDEVISQLWRNKVFNKDYFERFKLTCEELAKREFFRDVFDE